MKLLIVEDELLVRAGLRGIANWSEHGIDLLEDAVDGEQAVESIQLERPDIVLLDLRIPKLDGLSVLRKIKENGYRCRTIVISCYDDFQNVRDAMKLGATDYLHKLNIRPFELIKTILRIRDELIEANQQNPDAVKDLSVSPSRLSYQFSDVMNGVITPDQMDDRFDIGRAIVLTVDYPHVHFQNVHADLFLNLVRETVRSFNVDCCIHLDNQGMIYIALFSVSIPDLLFSTLQEQIKLTTTCIVSIGAGLSWMQKSDLLNAFQIARQITQYRFYRGFGQLRLFETPICFESLSTLNTALEKKLGEIIHEKRFSETIACLQDFLQEVGRHGNYKPDSVKASCIDAINLITHSLPSVGSQNGNRLDSIHSISTCQTLDELSALACSHLREIVDHIDQTTLLNLSSIVENAVTYINDHIFERLSLSNLATEVSVSESYLSTIFNKEIGESCITYINRRKIQIAQKLLTQNMLVYEVSEHLGFENSNYFSKVFKKYTGVSPESYRSMIDNDHRPTPDYHPAK